MALLDLQAMQSAAPEIGGASACGPCPVSNLSTALCTGASGLSVALCV
jgi:hypothetical protein